MPHEFVPFDKGTPENPVEAPQEAPVVADVAEVAAPAPVKKRRGRKPKEV